MNVSYKTILRHIAQQSPACFFQWCWGQVKSRLKYYKIREQKKSYGKNMPDKTFYIIGVNEGWCGLFAIIGHQLTHIAYAVERGYIPVVDLQNYENQYLSTRALFKENAWEYFFQQPMGYDLSSIKRAQNVIKSVLHVDPPDDKYRIGYASIYNPEVLAYYKPIYEKYIMLNSTSKTFLTNRYNELLKSKGRVLGVHCRGTDFITLKPNGHPIQPEPTEVIRKAEEVMSQYRCEYLYLATEDVSIYDMFTAYFGGRLILDDISKWHTTDLQKGKSNAKLTYDKEEKYNSGLEYLFQIYLLSQCTCFIAGNTRGSLGALLMPNRFEYSYIYDLGVY